MSPRLERTLIRTLRRLKKRHPHYTRWEQCRTSQHDICPGQCSGLPAGLCCACNCPCHTAKGRP